ncbi:DUF2079 domain-containing protein [Kitasatospora sp. MAP5-34]|uniref:DUF2079 domain-containing protein n=1 Tax=Kitasatospora sp. MAP5-34 TaxID=3035102 RepID=UPI00247707D7|nr:DUF2079 domain-containing protein [Kitasatospora sp. MAP5-34]MDH6577023.1 putative membrane protein [Kitasatospora sp. MAP5-34]
MGRLAAVDSTNSEAGTVGIPGTAGTQETSDTAEAAAIPEIPGQAAERRPARYLPWGLALAFFALYTLYSFRRHDLVLTTGYDLGIFEQAVRGYAEGHGPIVALKADGFNLLGDHFSPVLALLAPLYWLWPGAKALLLGQAALLALAVVPLSGWALRRLGTVAAVLVGVGYGASWGVASAVGFDFHEVSFAVPLVAFSVVALGEQRWRAAVLWAAPLVLVKEDLGVTVAAVGGYVCWRGARRLGLWTVVFGLAASALEMLVLLPAMNPGGSFAYWSTLGGAGGHSLLSLPLELVTPAEKARTLLLLLAPTALLAIRSPLLLIAVPTLAWRMLSSNPAYWGTSYHYSVVLMPIVFAAFVDVLSRRGGGALSSCWTRGAPAVGLAATLFLLPCYPLGQLGTPGFWRSSVRAEAAHSLLARIPSGARVAASNRLVPQLTDRCTVFVFGLPQQPWSTAQWLAVDDGQPMGWPLTPAGERAQLALAESVGYQVVGSEGGVTVLRWPVG